MKKELVRNTNYNLHLKNIKHTKTCISSTNSDTDFVSAVNICDLDTYSNWKAVCQYLLKLNTELPMTQ